MKQTIARLYKYRDALYKLKRLGLTKVFSDNLSDTVGVTSSQVRKDLLLYGAQGKKKAGYQIDSLLEMLNQTLSKNQVQNVIVVGAGHIGMALSNYQGFLDDGIHILAVFEKDLTKIDRSAKTPVLPLEELKGFVQEKQVRVGIIAVPGTAAQEVLNALALAGIQGALNFANTRLTLPHKEFVLNYVDVGLELETVIYSVNLLNKEQGNAKTDGGDFSGQA